MEIYNEIDQSTKQLDFSGTVKQLLHILEINPETVLITRNNEVLTEDEVLQSDNKVEILSVVSGG